MVVRGCGAARIAGGVYIEVALSPFGKPLEHFLLDPPVPLTEQMAIPSVGVHLRFVSGLGINHVIDRVGLEHYPNVIDVLEEGRKLGFSRRVPKNLDFSKLSPESRLILAHDRAIITNALDYYLYWGTEQTPGVNLPDWPCPRSQAVHTVLPDYEGERPECCAGVWWHDVDRATATMLHDPALPPRACERTTGEVVYRAYARPLEVGPSYMPGMFASLPIGRLAVVRAPDGSHEETAARISESYGGAVAVVGE